MRNALGKALASQTVHRVLDTICPRIGSSCDTEEDEDDESVSANDVNVDDEFFHGECLYCVVEVHNQEKEVTAEIIEPTQLVGQRKTFTLSRVSQYINDYLNVE